MSDYSAADLHFHGGQIHEASDLVLKFHYSRRLPSATVFVGSFHSAGGLFGDHGPMVAAAFFGHPATQWREGVLELTRLVRRDDVRLPLSRLLSLSLGHLRRVGYDLVVAYADIEQGHNGCVYRASGWRYGGTSRPTGIGLVINGEVIHGRTCGHMYGTRSAAKLRTQRPHNDISVHTDSGKAMYWRPLSRQGTAKAARLGMKSIDWRKL